MPNEKGEALKPKVSTPSSGQQVAMPMGGMPPPFPPFNHETDDIEVWSERLGSYFTAYDVPSEKQVAIFLTLLTNGTYSLLRDLCTPRKPATLTYADLVQLLSTHMKPKLSEMAERYKFRERRQGVGECIADYVAALKKLSLNCNFDNLEVNLRDQLVCGLNDISIKKKLLSEVALTFNKAFEVASTAEATAKEAKSMMNQSIVNYASRSMEGGSSWQRTHTSTPNLTTTRRREEKAQQTATTRR